MGRTLSLVFISFAEEMYGLFASEMRGSNNVCSIDAFGPNGLRGVVVSSRKHIAETADDSTAERKGTFADNIGNREGPTRHLDSRLV